MQYQGGKSRLAKHFAPVIEKALAKTNGFLYEPFTGGFNIQPALKPDAVKRAINGDAHLGLWSLYDALQNDFWNPPSMLTLAEWQMLKEKRDWSNPLTAFAAFGCSFRAYEFGAYAHNGDPENSPYARRAHDGLLRKAKSMGPVEFRWQDFECDLKGRATIYADPPYANTTGYGTGGFDHQRFYRWCGRMADAGHIVLVSEFTPPTGVDCQIVWEMPRKVAGRIDETPMMEQMYWVKRTL